MTFKSQIPPLFYTIVKWHRKPKTLPEIDGKLTQTERGEQGTIDLHEKQDAMDTKGIKKMQNMKKSTKCMQEEFDLSGGIEGCVEEDFD